LRTALLIALVLCLQYGCVHDTSQLRAKLDAAVQRHASIDERIIDWGTPSGKDLLSDGRIVYTWKLPWTGNYINYGVPGGQAYPVQHWCTIIITAAADNTVQSYKYRDC
jgi:hypothetical protein